MGEEWAGQRCVWGGGREGRARDGGQVERGEARGGAAAVIDWSMGWGELEH